MKIENPKDLDFTKLNASLTDFQIYGPEVTSMIDKMSFWISRFVCQEFKFKIHVLKREYQIRKARSIDQRIYV
jgi:hypothetical protein